MKDYKVKSLSEPNPLSRTILITNKDENPIIESIKLSHYGPKQQYYSIFIDFAKNAETQEMKAKFEQIAGNSKMMMGAEGHVNVKKMDVILQNLKVVQTIDPIPDGAFVEVMELAPKIDLSQLLKRAQMLKLLEQHQHAKALQKALEADSQGDLDSLVFLANHYSEIGDSTHYVDVLEQVPNTNPHFESVNLMLHEHYNALDPSTLTSEAQLGLLEKKFRTALNAKLESVSGLYDQLCGNNGLNPVVRSIKGDATTLIEIARMHRNMRLAMEEEIKQLKAQLTSSQTQQTGKNVPNQNAFFSQGKTNESVQETISPQSSFKS